MSSPFIGLNVKLTLHSQPHLHLYAKILSIDQAANTLTVQKLDGSHAVLERTDIASLAAAKPVETTSEKAATPAAAKRNSNQDAAASTPSDQPQPHLLAPKTADPVGSRTSTPSRSPRPQNAAAGAQTPRSAKKKAAALASVSRGSSPAIPNASLSDEFDFSAGLKAFDKKKIWDDIRASDHTDPASLLVSHNRIANAPVELVRGPNGVGPANSVSTPDRGRSNKKDGQQKLRPNEMVLSPSPERVPSPTPASPAAPVAASVPVSAAPSQPAGKPSYEELEQKIRKLEAELALARRRNALLEELAGLGLGVSARTDAGADYSASPAAPTAPPASQPAQASLEVRSESRNRRSDQGVAETTRDLSNMTLQASAAPTGQEPRSSTPAALSSALAAAGFAISGQSTQSSSAGSTPAPASQPAEVAAEKEEAVFGHIVEAPVLTLFFPTAALQHAALARIEAFYESDTNGKRYLTLQEAADERICRNYQGFNFPLRQGVQDWLDAMHDAVGSDTEAEAQWWRPQCSAEEVQLLELLVSLRAISAYEGSSARSDDGEAAVSYVISCVASQAHSTLPHERLHALYFLSASYRALVAQLYDSLSAPAKKVIEADLALRKYAPAVWRDEFQAYLAEGPATEKEFGNKPASECKLIAQQLRAQLARLWTELGARADETAMHDAWENVKWHTLDRYAAAQKKKPATAKGKKKGRK